jgi:hypothetical protein
VDERETSPATEEGNRLGEERDRLLEAGARLPGVAEVLQVYGRLAPYAPTPVIGRAPTRYATGGNP